MTSKQNMLAIARGHGFDAVATVNGIVWFCQWTRREQDGTISHGWGAFEASNPAELCRQLGY